MTQETSTLLNAKEFYKGRKMILFAFESDIFPLPKQYPSNSDCKEDDIDSSKFLPEGFDILLPSFQRKEKNKEKNQKTL